MRLLLKYALCIGLVSTLGLAFQEDDEDESGITSECSMCIAGCRLDTNSGYEYCRYSFCAFECRPEAKPSDSNSGYDTVQGGKPPDIIIVQAQGGQVTNQGPNAWIPSWVPRAPQTAPVAIVQASVPGPRSVAAPVNVQFPGEQPVSWCPCSAGQVVGVAPDSVMPGPFYGYTAVRSAPASASDPITSSSQGPETPQPPAGVASAPTSF